MQARINPYISFNGNAREAMERYKELFGGSLTQTTFKEGGMSQGDADAELIMHSQLETDNDMVLMGADMPPSMEYKPAGNVSVSLSGTNVEELRAAFAGLSDGGMIVEPMEKAPWGDWFGMVVDRFGVFWMVNASEQTHPEA